MNMKKALVLTLIPVVFMSFAFGCRKTEEETDKDEILVMIDDMTITVSEYEQAIKRFVSGLKGGGPLDEETAMSMKEEILNDLIKKKILLAEAASMEISVSEEELDAEIERIIAEYPNYETFNNWLGEQGIEFDQWRTEMKYNILLDKLVKAVAEEDVEITDLEVEEYYNEHKEDYDAPEMVNSLQIMVETEEEAVLILERVNNGEDFSELAREVSITPDAVNGGELGYYAMEFMPPVFEITFEMKEGEVSDVIESPYGFHIFKVIDTKEAKEMTLEEARPEIEERLKREKFEEEYAKWFQDIKEKRKIDVINPTILEDFEM